jgi:hypothetical protein
MSRSNALRAADVRAVFRLVGECRELGDDPIRWRRHLLDKLARFTGAGLAVEYEGEWVPYRPVRSADQRSENGFTVDASFKTWLDNVVAGADWGWENGFDRRAGERLYTELARRGARYNPMTEPYLTALERSDRHALTRADVLRDAVWYRSAYFRDHLDPVGADAMLMSVDGLSGGRRVPGRWFKKSMRPSPSSSAGPWRAVTNPRRRSCRRGCGRCCSVCWRGTQTNKWPSALD